MERIKTAAYCRVSTDKETQDGSYELQESYFRDLIEADPTMELVGIYGDKGRSGLNVTGRPGLQQLMEDCRAGKIQLIMTKSISRFARNMAECAEMVRELSRLSVKIIFEEQNLDSTDEKTALILSIFAALAEEESHSISQHAILAHEQYTLEGRPFGVIAFGYKNGGNNNWIVNEEQAPLVKKAFEMAAEGKTYAEIRGTLKKMDGGKWSTQRLKRMLTHVAYKGDYYSHATVCVVPGKQVENKGFRDRYYIEEHHDPIVSRELFDRVQEIVGRGILVSNRKRTEQDEEFLRNMATGGAYENSNEG